MRPAPADRRSMRRFGISSPSARGAASTGYAARRRCSSSGPARPRSCAEGDRVRLVQLSPPMLARLEDKIAIPSDRRVPFAEMGRIYRLRAPMTKARATFIPQCRRIAEDYRAMGARYVELSLADVVDAD